MKTKFDKIYVLSLITNKERQKFIKQQFNKLSLKYEFIYGTDFYNLKHDATGKEIQYPNVWNNFFLLYLNPTVADYGCALTHYQAILQAYELGYNNILIIEDDICFIKNKKLIEYYLNNIPEDADFITFDPRFIFDDTRNDIYQRLKECKDDWLYLDNNIELIGGMFYGLMNRETMKLYLDNQRLNFNMSDHIIGIFDRPTVKRYIGTKCLCTDQYNLSCNFSPKIKSYTNIYYMINSLKYEDFNLPSQYNQLLRNSILKDVQPMKYPDKEY